MGKKRIIKKTEKELIEEKEKVDGNVAKEAKAASDASKASVQPAGKDGRVYISSSYNNTIITLTDSQGNVVSGISAGSIGFKGTKKSTPFAASKVAEALAQNAKNSGIDKVKVFVKGIGAGRESAIRSLAARGMDIIAIKDVTPIPHNGCRPPKVRRV